MTRSRSEPVTEARLEAALLQSAELAKEYPFTRPIYERIERELLELRSRNDPVARARSLLRNQQEPMHELRTT